MKVWPTKALYSTTVMEAPSEIKDKKSSSSSRSAGGLLLLLVVAGGIGSAVWFAISFFAHINPTVAAAGLGVLFSVGSLVFTKVWERRDAIRQHHRDRKVPIYEEFMQFWFGRLFKSVQAGHEISEEEVQQFLIDFTQKFTLWASDEFFRAYVHFRRQSATLSEEEATHVELVFEYEALLYALRKDLGHSNKGLGRGDLLSLFINDIDEYLVPVEETSSRP